MKNLLIGSRALNYWFPEVPIKESTDWDVISTNRIEGTEWHDPEFLQNKVFEVYTNSRDVIWFNGELLYVVAPIGLAIIKRSHLWRDLGFGKHITHYSKYLRDVFIKESSPFDQSLLRERTKLTVKEFPQGNPNLMQSKEDFFDDAVTKKYDHDFLHELFAYEDRPLYTKLLRDPNMAWCEKSKWDELSELQKQQCVAEETQVIATERFLVPNAWKFPGKLAYYKALSKVCTTLCSGWFRDYAIDNFDTIYKMYDQSRFDIVKSKLERN